MDISNIIARARSVLRSNDAGGFTKPGPRQYPHQWNWDSAVIALGLSHFDLPRALTEIRSLLRGQWRDGMLPHIVYHDAPSGYFPDSAFWQIESNPNAPSIPTSGITQPPILATVIRKIHARTPIANFIRETYPALLRWHRWLHSARDADGSGLVCIIHPWESGTDDSPRWLSAMSSITPADVPLFQRGDTIHVDATERPYSADYDRFIHLIDVFRRHRYDPASLIAHSPFLVQDIFFNSLLYRANEDLRALATELGAPTAEIDNWLDRMSAHFDSRFWDATHGSYFDFDLRAGGPIRVNTAMTFSPLFAGLPDDMKSLRLIANHWQNPMEYKPDENIRYRVTTTSMDEPAWEPRRYWRGPVWIIFNWILWDGFRRYGYDDLANELRRDSLELVARSGFREYYDPRDGSGCGSTNFSWSAALTIDWLAKDL